MLALTRSVTVRNNRMFPARAVDLLPLARCGWVSYPLPHHFKTPPPVALEAVPRRSRHKFSRNGTSHLQRVSMVALRVRRKLMLVCAQQHPNPQRRGSRENPGKHTTTSNASVELLYLRAVNSTPRTEPEFLVRGQSGRAPVEVGASFARLNPTFHSQLPVIVSGSAPSHCFQQAVFLPTKNSQGGMLEWQKSLTTRRVTAFLQWRSG